MGANSKYSLSVATKGLIAGLLASLLVLASVSFCDLPEASAAGRAVSLTNVCTPAATTPGVEVSCVVTVTDIGSDNKNPPEGSLAFSVTTPGKTSAVATVTDCVLAKQLRSQSTCTGKLVFLDDDGGVSGGLVLRAAYTSTDGHLGAIKHSNITVGSTSTAIYLPQSITAVRRSAVVGIYGVKCSSGTWGLWVSGTGDPKLQTGPANYGKPGDFLAQTGGGWIYTPTVPVDEGLGTVYLHFYCATSAPESPTASSITWESSLITSVISAATLQRVSAGGSPGVAPSNRVYVQDPEALPGVDLLDLNGDAVAAMKTRVDAGRLTRLAIAAQCRTPSRSLVDRFSAQVAAGDTSGLQRALAATPEFFITHGVVMTQILFATHTAGCCTVHQARGTHRYSQRAVPAKGDSNWGSGPLVRSTRAAVPYCRSHLCVSQLSNPNHRYARQY